MAGFGPWLNAIGAGLGMGVNDLVQQRQKEQQLENQRMGMQKQLFELNQYLQNQKQQQDAALLGLGGFGGLGGGASGSTMPASFPSTGAGGDAAPLGPRVSLPSVRALPTQQTTDFGAPGEYGVGQFAPGPSGRLSYQQLANAAQGVGFPPAAAGTMAAIDLAESGGNPMAVNLSPAEKGGSFGVAQINAVHPGAQQTVGDVPRSMQMAYDISKGGTDFSPWTTFRTGAYKQFADQGGTPTRQFDGTALEGGTQVAQADTGTMTDAGPQAPPMPQAPNVAQIIAQTQAEGRQMGATPVAIANAAKARIAQAQTQYRDDLQVWQAQQVLAQREIANKRAGTHLLQTPQGLVEWHPGQPIPQGATVGGSGSQSTGRERDMEREITRLDEEFKANNPKATKAQIDAQHFKNRTVVEKDLGASTRVPRSAPAMYIQKYMEENPNASAADIARAASIYRREQAIESGFATGQNANQMRQLNTLADHLDLLRGYADALQVGDIPKANQAWQALMTNLGHPEVTTFALGRDLAANEMVRLITATGGTEADRQQMQAAFAASMSPQQMAGAINAAAAFAGSRFGALEQLYARNDPARRKEFEEELLTPSARNIFVNRQPPSGAAAQGGVGGAAAAPAYNSAADVAKAYQDGKISRDDAAKVLRDRGWAE